MATHPRHDGALPEIHESSLSMGTIREIIVQKQQLIPIPIQLNFRIDERILATQTLIPRKYFDEESGKMKNQEESTGSRGLYSQRRVEDQIHYFFLAGAFFLAVFFLAGAFFFAAFFLAGAFFFVAKTLTPFPE